MGRRKTTPVSSGRIWRAALYTRLSREDGDKGESNSIATQKAILEEYISRDPALSCAGVYVDTATPAPILTAPASSG